jgi:hypothetical protein
MGPTGSLAEYSLVLAPGSMAIAVFTATSTIATTLITVTMAPCLTVAIVHSITSTQTKPATDKVMWATPRMKVAVNTRFPVDTAVAANMAAVVTAKEE